MFYRILTLSIFFSIQLFAITKIEDISLNKKENNGYDIIVTFDKVYHGNVARKSGNSIQKVILNQAISPRSFSRHIEDSNLLTKIDIFPFHDRTDIALSLLQRADINYYAIDSGKGIVISIVQQQPNVEKISPQGQSLMDNIPSGYTVTISILVIGIIVLYVLRKNIKNNNPGILQSVPQNQDWPLNQQLSLTQTQQPELDLKIRKNPNSKIKQQQKKSSYIPNMTLFKKSDNNRNLEESNEKRQKNTYVKTIFTEEIDIGTISMIEVENSKYLILREEEKYSITILDKIQRVKEKEKPITTSSEQKQDEKLQEKEFDIKIPKIDEVEKKQDSKEDE